NAAAKDSSLKTSSDQAKAVYLYKTIMDTAARNKLGLKPLKPYLDKIDAVSNLEELQNLLIEMEPKGGIGFFGLSVDADSKNSNKNVAYLESGTLGMSRDYYVEEDTDAKEKRE